MRLRVKSRISKLNFQGGLGLIFHVNHLLAEDSQEVSCGIIIIFSEDMGESSKIPKS